MKQNTLIKVNHRRHYRSKSKRKRSSNAIHVTIKRSNISNFTNKNKNICQNRSLLSMKCSSLESKTDIDTIHNKMQQSDCNGAVDNYHRKIKKKKRGRCFIYLIMIWIIFLIILIIILILLLKQKSMVTKSNKIAALRWNRTGMTITGTAGISGTSSNQLNLPFDIAVDYAYNIYVLDYGNHRIQKYRFGNTTGQTVAGNGTSGPVPYQLSWPSQMLLDSNNDFLISQYGANDVVFWSNGGSFGERIAGTGIFGTSNNQFSSLCGLALHPTPGTLYVADLYNHRIMSYPKGASAGTLLFGGQGSGTNRTQLSGPAGIYLDLISNSLLIANYFGNNVVRYVIGATEWTLAAGDPVGNPGSAASQLNIPIKVILDPMGNMYVADAVNDRIQFYSSGQINGTTILGQTGVPGISNSLLSRPRSVAFDNQLNLYVVEESNCRVQKFLRY